MKASSFSALVACVLILALVSPAAFSHDLTPQPVNPPEPFLGPAPRISDASLPVPNLPLQHQADAGFDFVDTTQREETRIFFNTVYQSSEGIPIVWTGDINNCDEGDTAVAYREGVRRRINYFRAMAGVPAHINLNPDFNFKDQQCALMLSVNNQLNHFPPETWDCYTEAGAEAAENSNLFLGAAGADAISGYIRDHGPFNHVVGHRRWLIYPQTSSMGTGDLPRNGENGGFSPSNANWVKDGSFGSPRPATRDNFVAWPPPGFVPSPVVYPRWSFSYPGAQFGNATVNMLSNNIPVDVRLETLGTGFGENTLVWVPMGLDANKFETSFPHDGEDTEYSIQISGVLINGSPTSFDYQVTVFDPDVPGEDFTEPVISGPLEPSVSSPNPYHFTQVPTATHYQWRFFSTELVDLFNGAEQGLDGLMTFTSEGYQVVQEVVKASGSRAFHLAHAEPTAQILRLDRELLATPDSELVLKSRLGWATENQVAKIQVSATGGTTWATIFEQRGHELSSPVETSFQTHSFNLSEYSGKPILFRFAYLYEFGSYYPNSDPASGAGWFLDDIQWNNLEEFSEPQISETDSQDSFVFTPESEGAYKLQVRPVVYDQFPLGWGPILSVTAIPGNEQPLLRIRSITHNNNQLIFVVHADNFTWTSDPMVEHKSTLTSNWETENSASVQPGDRPEERNIAIPFPEEPQGFFRVRL